MIQLSVVISPLAIEVSDHMYPFIQIKFLISLYNKE